MKRSWSAICIVLVIAVAGAPVPATPAPWAFTVTDVAVAAGEPATLHVTLAFDAHAPSEERSFTVSGDHTAPDGTPGTVAPAPATLTVAPNASTSWSFPASRGPGTYVLSVAAADGPSVDGVEVFVPAGPSEATFAASVPDHPTTLSLTSDSVNADGKRKRAGEAVVTRVDVADDNGLDDVASLAFHYDRVLMSGGTVRVATQTAALNASALAAEVEDRFDHAPLAAGPYQVTVTATARDGNATTVTRSFEILDTAPFLAASPAWEPSRLRAGSSANATAALAFADRNFGTGPLDATSVPAFGLVSWRVYRGSSLVPDNDVAVRVAGAATPLDLTSTGHRDAAHYTTVGTSGVLHVLATAAVNEHVEPGALRVSFYHADDANSTTRFLGSASLDVEDAPRVASATVTPSDAAPGGRVTASWSTLGPAPEHIEVTLVRATNASWTPVAAPVTVPGDVTTAVLAVPSDIAGGRFGVRVAALGGDPEGAVAPFDVTAGPPSLRLAAPGAVGRLTAPASGGAVAFAVHARNFSLAEAALTWRFANGEPASDRVRPDPAGGFTFDATGLAPGRYRIAGAAVIAGGEATDALVIDVGAQLAVRFAGPPTVDFDTGGATAVVPIAAVGNMPLTGLEVTVVGAESWSGVVAVVDARGVDRVVAPLDASGRARLAGALLAVGETGAHLEARVAPPRGADAGVHELRLRAAPFVPGAAP